MAAPAVETTAAAVVAAATAAATLRFIDTLDLTLTSFMIFTSAPLFSIWLKAPENFRKTLSENETTNH
ncbi:unnamed protein product [Soboliphyme baturini]|uniref:Uncharacterized protein n=1 Tax=Soboliphyme baturini TaxID=241478 RepID=A0A183IIG5_9BILA|nr:unnamed protein product [Soboliphyme baturini]